MKKENIIFIVVGALIAVMASSITAYATNYIYNADEVSYNSTDVQTAIDNLYDEASEYAALRDMIYPVGSIYMSTCEGGGSCDDTEAKVEARFGGDWTKIEGRFLVGAGTYTAPTSGGVLGDSNQTYTVGETGGAATVKLTGAQSGTPYHNHSYTNPKIPNHKHYIPQHSHTVTLTMKMKYTGSAASGSGGNIMANSGSSNSTAPWSTSGGSINNNTDNTGNPTSLGSTSGGGPSATTATNASSAHTNLPFYNPVYMYKRVS